MCSQMLPAHGTKALSQVSHLRSNQNLFSGSPVSLLFRIINQEFSGDPITRTPCLLPLQGAWVPPLVGELSYYKPRGAAKSNSQKIISQLLAYKNKQKLRQAQIINSQEVYIRDYLMETESSKYRTPLTCFLVALGISLENSQDGNRQGFLRRQGHLQILPNIQCKKTWRPQWQNFWHRTFLSGPCL